jgi:hypothetical protein
MVGPGIGYWNVNPEALCQLSLMNVERAECLVHVIPQERVAQLRRAAPSSLYI